MKKILLLAAILVNSIVSAQMIVPVEHFKQPLTEQQLRAYFLNPNFWQHAEEEQNSKLKSLCMLPKSTTRPRLKRFGSTTTITKSLLLSYKPKKWPFKFTIKPGLNTTQARQILNIDKSDPDWKDCFDEMNFTGVAKYDMRLKFYTSKRTRIVLRALVTYPKTLYTVGWTYKF